MATARAPLRKRPIPNVCAGRFGRWKKAYVIADFISKQRSVVPICSITKRILSMVVLILAMAVPSGCSANASSTEIRADIDEALSKQEQAHQIAEYVRSFGEDDSHPAVLFAKEKWQEQEKAITHLEKQYEKAVKAEQKKAEKGKYIGRFRISHYCNCAKCNGSYTGTAIGKPLTPWHTLAVDPSIIPLGSTVHIDGYGDFSADDTGGAIKGNRIDVCVGSHQEAYRLGVTYKDVYVKYE